MQALKPQSEVLQNIDDYFAPLTRHVRTFNFWEGKKTGGGYVVCKESAAPSGNAHEVSESAELQASHAELVRFADPESADFRLVLDVLIRYCTEAPGVIRSRLAAAGGTSSRPSSGEDHNTTPQTDDLTGDPSSSSSSRRVVS